MYQNIIFKSYWHKAGGTNTFMAQIYLLHSLSLETFYQIKPLKELSEKLCDE